MDYLQSRHIGVSEQEEALMLQTVGAASLDELIDQIIPADIRLPRPLNLPAPLTERRYAEHVAELAAKNKLFTSYIGQGWYDTCTPAPILRNVLENPAWYTSYTPYQAEISQGRLEALFNFQTAVADLTALPLANASLLDEATAAAEAATMMYSLRTREQVKAGANVLFVDRHIFPQTMAVLRTRMGGQGIEVETGDYFSFRFTDRHFGAIVQYPNSDGSIEDYASFVTNAHDAGCKVAVAADLMSLALLTPPGDWGADIVFGSAQRLGTPMYYGGPSAAFFATREAYKREIPGRVIGISRDANGRPAFRLALQTREQHIKREKATSNICTAQALLAIMSGFYAVYHGAKGLRAIATRIHSIASYLNELLPVYGYSQSNTDFFDTLKVALPAGVEMEHFKAIALKREVNFHYFDSEKKIGLSVDETTDLDDVNTLIDIFAEAVDNTPSYAAAGDWEGIKSFDEKFDRTSDYLTHEVFLNYHTETELMRYIKRLERRDISLANSMIPLGSCTMKLNAASELLPLSRPEIAQMHPLVPDEQAAGYHEMLGNLAEYLSEITGLAGCSLQPNSGAAGEYAGLMLIRSYLRAKGEEGRRVILIPASAHGTNPASCVQAGFIPMVVATDQKGNVDMDDWQRKAQENASQLAGCMITYPSTHGVFEGSIREMCRVVHSFGGQVYMDGANMNAQIGLTNPGFIGADVCHLNLHKTFSSPHGGGGPGSGPICCAEHLVPFLPSVSFGENTVAAAPHGSAGIDWVAYGYIRMMGSEGLTRATKAAILNANYLCEKLRGTYGVVYTGSGGRVAHELILDCRPLKALAGVTETDVAKRLIDYGYHAPTLSFPVHGTLMVEPTESESLTELEHFIDAMQTIYKEAREIAQGESEAGDNVLINAPHPQYCATADEWTHPYSRQKALYPLPWIEEAKVWVNVARVDNGWGDRNLITSWNQTTKRT